MSRSTKLCTAMSRVTASHLFVSRRQELSIPLEYDVKRTREQDPVGAQLRRRVWLLLKALEIRPLDEALELARSAETFITG